MDLLATVLPLLYAAAAAGGAYAAVRVELRFVWRDMGQIQQAVTRAHERIDQVLTDDRG